MYFCRGLTNIDILQGYIHLRYLDLSNNNIDDIQALNSLQHLLVLKLDNNQLANIQLDELPYLQVASFNYNRIKSLEGVNHPQLEHLSINCELMSSMVVG